MKKLILGILILISTNAHANTISLGTISADATASGHNDNYTTTANVINGNIEGSCDSGTTVCNVKAGSLFEINMANDANPRVRDSELFNITVDTISAGAVASQGTVVESGCVQATDSDLTADVSACVAYINGYRVSKAATAQTYASSSTTYLWLSQTGVYTQSTNPNTSIANSSLLASVVTSGSAITTVTNLFTSRVPGLIVPVQYRNGLVVSRDSTTTIKVFPGSAEINNSLLTKTSTTTLTITTASDWAGASSLQATSTYGYVGMDSSGNLKMHTTAPTHDNYAVSTTAGKKRYATWSSTVYRILGWFYMNATGSGELNTWEVGNIKEGDVSNAMVQGATSTQAVTSTTSDTIIDDSTFNFYCSGGPINILGNINGLCDAARLTNVGIYVDGTEKKQSRSGMFCENSFFMGMNPQWLEINPSQGTHTITIRGRTSAGTLTVNSRDAVVMEL